MFGDSWSSNKMGSRNILVLFVVLLVDQPSAFSPLQPFTGAPRQQQPLRQSRWSGQRRSHVHVQRHRNNNREHVCAPLMLYHPQEIGELTHGLAELSRSFGWCVTTEDERSLSRYKLALRTATEPYLSVSEQRKVFGALVVAYQSHSGQVRKSGEAYIEHPLSVALILAHLRMDVDAVCAGLLHDTVEDTRLTFEDVERVFGPAVRRIVQGETKVSKLDGYAAAVSAASASTAALSSTSQTGASGGPPLLPPNNGEGTRGEQQQPQHKQEQQQQDEQQQVNLLQQYFQQQELSYQQKKQDEQQERVKLKEKEKLLNLRGLLSAMSKDWRVLVVKLADRLHNMRTIHAMPLHKQKRIAQETLEVFVPLAHRLGVWNIKEELADRAFAILEPATFKAIEAALRERRQQLGQSRLRSECARLQLQLQQYTLSSLSFKRIQGNNSCTDSLEEPLEDEGASDSASFALGDRIAWVRVKVRTKGVYNVWRSMQRKKQQEQSEQEETEQGSSVMESVISVRDVADAVTLQIVFDLTDDDVDDDDEQMCYAMLEAVHALYPPCSPPKVKDYLAFPKPNGYKGLHSVVLMPLNDTPITAMNDDDDDDDVDDDNDDNIERDTNEESNDLGLRSRRRENREHGRRGQSGSVNRNKSSSTGSGNGAAAAMDAAAVDITTLVPIEFQLRTSSMDTTAMFGSHMVSHMASTQRQRLRSSSGIERRGIDEDKDDYGDESDDDDDSDDLNDGSNDGFGDYYNADGDNFADFGLPWLKSLPVIGRTTHDSFPSPPSMVPSSLSSSSLSSSIVDNTNNMDTVSDRKPPLPAPPLPSLSLPPTFSDSLFPIMTAPTAAEQLARSIASQLSLDRRFVFTSQGALLNLRPNATISEAVEKLVCLPKSDQEGIRWGSSNSRTSSISSKSILSAKVNGREAPMNQLLRNGDLVSIVTDPQLSPIQPPTSLTSAATIAVATSAATKATSDNVPSSSYPNQPCFTTMTSPPAASSTHLPFTTSHGVSMALVGLTTAVHRQAGGGGGGGGGGRVTSAVVGERKKKESASVHISAVAAASTATIATQAVVGGTAAATAAAAFSDDRKEEAVTTSSSDDGSRDDADSSSYDDSSRYAGAAWPIPSPWSFSTLLNDGTLADDLVEALQLPLGLLSPQGRRRRDIRGPAAGVSGGGEGSGDSGGGGDERRGQGVIASRSRSSPSTTSISSWWRQFSLAAELKHGRVALCFLVWRCLLLFLAASSSGHDGGVSGHSGSGHGLNFISSSTTVIVTTFAHNLGLDHPQQQQLVQDVAGGGNTFDATSLDTATAATAANTASSAVGAVSAAGTAADVGMGLGGGSGGGGGGLMLDVVHDPLLAVGGGEDFLADNFPPSSSSSSSSVLQETTAPITAWDQSVQNIGSGGGAGEGVAAAGSVASAADAVSSSSSSSLSATTDLLASPASSSPYEDLMRESAAEAAVAVAASEQGRGVGSSGGLAVTAWLPRDKAALDCAFATVFVLEATVQLLLAFRVILPSEKQLQAEVEEEGEETKGAPTSSDLLDADSPLEAFVDGESFDCDDGDYEAAAAVIVSEDDLRASFGELTERFVLNDQKKVLSFPFDSSDSRLLGDFESMAKETPPFPGNSRDDDAKEEVEKTAGAVMRKKKKLNMPLKRIAPLSPGISERTTAAAALTSVLNMGLGRHEVVLGRAAMVLTALAAFVAASSVNGGSAL